MKINRHNYESYLIDYIEGNISDQDRGEMQIFLSANPDIYAEMQDINNIILAPKAADTLQDKYLLKRDNITEAVNCNYIEKLCIAKIENDISETEETELKNIIKDNTQNARTLELFAKTKLKSNNNIKYPYKKKLEKNITLNKYFYYKISAVAAMFATIFLINFFLLQDYQSYYKNTLSANNKFINKHNIENYTSSEQKTEPQTINFVARNTAEPINIDTIKTNLNNDAEQNYVYENLNFENQTTETINIETILAIHDYEFHETILTESDKDLLKYLSKPYNKLSLQEQYELAKQTITKQLENNIQKDVNPLDIANAAIKGFNSLTESEIEINKFLDSNGNLTAQSITTPIIDFFNNKLGK